MNEQSAPQEAIRSLYDLYANDIYRYALITLGDSFEAYDVVQEVFLRAYRSWGSYRKAATPKTWLMSITRNYIFDIYRKKGTERKYMSQSNPHSLELQHDEALAMDDLLDVQEALRQLPEHHRQVIILRYIENLSMQETAEILGWSITKVRNTSHRSLLKLRATLVDSHEEVSRPYDVRTRDS